MRSIYPALVFAVATLTCPSTVIRATAPAGTDRVEEDWSSSSPIRPRWGRATGHDMYVPR